MSIWLEKLLFDEYVFRVQLHSGETRQPISANAGSKHSAFFPARHIGAANPTKPASVYFDLGVVRPDAAWFVQHIAGEVRLIDFH